MITQRGLLEQNKAFHPMAREKIDGFFLQFPWLDAWLASEREVTDGPYFRWHHIHQIYVSGIDLSFPSMKPLVCIRNSEPPYFMRSDNILYCPGMREAVHSEKIYLLDKTGLVVIYRSKDVRKERHYFFWQKEVVVTDELKSVVTSGLSVRDCLHRDVPFHYALSYLSHTKALIIYRPPRGLSIQEWLKERKIPEKVEFQTELGSDILAIDSTPHP